MNCIYCNTPTKWLCPVCGEPTCSRCRAHSGGVCAPCGNEQVQPLNFRQIRNVLGKIEEMNVLIDEMVRGCREVSAALESSGGWSTVPSAPPLDSPIACQPPTFSRGEIVKG